jgi:hypothetical protein
VASRYVVGIDLGTTNSALAYVDTTAAEGEPQRPVILSVPQVVQPGVVESLSPPWNSSATLGRSGGNVGLNDDFRVMSGVEPRFLL